MSRILTMIEISQKQAYIFADNKLADNISRSAEIALITGGDYITETAERSGDTGLIFKEEDNLVYSGGGHTILEFKNREEAFALVRILTRRVLEEFPEISLFAASVDYDDDKTPGENIRHLTEELEKKKSIRRSFFHQGTYGVEKIDRNSGKAELINKKTSRISDLKDDEPPRGFVYSSEFEKLGGSQGDSNFIAIVHIDGNAMGKRVEALSAKFGRGDWEAYKSQMRLFSESIAGDFFGAYREMEQMLADAIWNDKLPGLSLSYKGDRICLPVRRVISEGDDICFVSDGRIGIECAAAFLRFLGKKVNVVDGKPYAACAGVALVHHKYPFYRAYELAEELCSNAKRLGVNLAGAEEGTAISSIDWHLEFGEIQDSLEDTRRQYECADGNRLEMRPLIVLAPEELMAKETVRRYDAFCRLMKAVVKNENSWGRSLIKELRTVLKRGKMASDYFIRFHQMNEIALDAWSAISREIRQEDIRIGEGAGRDWEIFVKCADEKNRSILFDAIELMDTFLPLEGAFQ